MSRTVTVGLDGSPESLAAADLAAIEAHLRAVPLRVVHAGEQQPYAYAPFAAEAVALPGEDRSARMLHDVEVSLTHRHPGLKITTEQLSGHPVTVLSVAAREAEVLVLGSRGLGRAAGRLFGSVAPAVVGRAEGPVLLVRAGACVAGEHRADTRGPASWARPYRDVVLGLRLPGECAEAVLEFAFDAAARRATGLRVVHGWKAMPSPWVGEGDESAMQPESILTETLRPWREKFPGVEVTEEAVIGRPGSHLADASRDALLVVLGRRRHHVSVGPHLGPVTHEVLQSASAPVAVVPHG
ncbi:universal stress protein [Streptomyces cyaneochromogenes]|uniref:Universal stress protein n=1 Tax=Streptomyces cyaneochromogenes TaxID=2496836 RepID=A0A3S9MJV4_9ACTN|nr:universal stress protein [Streptomyces cyaneochromogenes]AZQ39465.1 universal stress protein [Streptomyces cyaneochromogenes]